MTESEVDRDAALDSPATGHRAQDVDSQPASKWTWLGPALAIALYLLAVLLGATSSSIGIGSLRADPAHPNGVMFGSARPVRSDEWLSYTPTVIGYMVTGSEKATSSPLSEPNDLASQFANSGPAELITFFDTTALRLRPIIPERMLYAAFYWLPTLLLLLALPPWLRRLGSNTALSWLATALIVLAPANSWWSLNPVRILGFAVAGCYLAMVAADRYRTGHRAVAVAVAVIAGVLLARTPFVYLPWELTIAIPVIVATGVWMLWSGAQRRERLPTLAVVAVSSLGLFGWTLAENLASFRAEAGTVYPGRRVSGAVRQGISTLFGAPNLGFLQTSPLIKGSNTSELSTAFTICGVWALIALLLTRRRIRWTPESAAGAALAAFLLFWFLWSALTIPGTEHLPVANLVPSNRSNQTVGFVAVLVLVLVLSRTSRRLTWLQATTCAVLCAFVTGVAGVALRRTVPSTSHLEVLVGAVGTGVVVLTVSRFPQRAWPTVLASLCAAALVVSVNPLIFGLGDLRDSSTATRMSAIGRQARHDDTYWVTDSILLDAVAIANGVPSLSGHQTSGPDVAQWHKLDPTDKYKSVWNRGASYLEFAFTQNKVPAISLGSTEDQIIVSVDPCQLPALGFPIAGVISTSPLTNSCLHAQPSVQWGGGTGYVYLLA